MIKTSTQHPAPSFPEEKKKTKEKNNHTLTQQPVMDSQPCFVRCVLCAFEEEVGRGGVGLGWAEVRVEDRWMDGWMDGWMVGWDRS